MKRLPHTPMHNYFYALFLSLMLIPDLFAGSDMAVPVQIAEAIEEEIAPVTWVSGTIIGTYDSSISSEVDGLLEEVVEVGDYLEKGDVIARVDSLTIHLRKLEIESELIPVAAKLEFYRREVERLTMLAEHNNAAKSRLDEMISEREQAIGQIKIIKARLAQVNDQMKKCTIRAPFSGIITERFSSKGERLETGDEVVRLVNTDELEIQARIPSDAITLIKKGSELEVTDGERNIISIVRAVVPVGDDVSRLYELRLDFNEPGWAIGHAVRVAVPIAKKRRVTAVPRDALVIRQDGTKVFRVNENGIAEVIPVKTGMANNTYIEIKNGINIGDRIVIRGNERLRPGQRVVIEPEKSPP